MQQFFATDDLKNIESDYRSGELTKHISETFLSPQLVQQAKRRVMRHLLSSPDGVYTVMVPHIDANEFEKVYLYFSKREAHVRKLQRTKSEVNLQISQLVSSIAARSTLKKAKSVGDVNEVHQQTEDRLVPQQTQGICGKPIGHENGVEENLTISSNILKDKEREIEILQIEINTQHKKLDKYASNHWDLRMRHTELIKELTQLSEKIMVQAETISNKDKIIENLSETNQQLEEGEYIKDVNDQKAGKSDDKTMTDLQEADLTKRKPKEVRRFTTKLSSDEADPCIQDIVVDETGNVFVADSNNKCVKCFDGECKNKWTSKIDANPNNVSLVNQMHLAVIKLFSTCLDILRTDDGVKIKEVEHGMQCGAPGLVICGETVVISNTNLHLVCIYKMSSDYSLFKMHTISQEMGVPPLIWPHYVHIITSNQNIVVSDRNTHTVQAFTSQGEYIFTYGASGPEHMDMQYGVCTDSKNNILIADMDNHRIVLLTPNGQFEKYLLTKDDGLSWPLALSLVKGQLYIAEFSDIKVFH